MMFQRWVIQPAYRNTKIQKACMPLENSANRPGLGGIPCSLKPIEHSLES